MIILGSYPVENIVERQSKDLDLLCTLDQFRNYVGQHPTIIDKGHAFIKTPDRIYDAEIIWPDTLSQELYDLIASDPNSRWDFDKEAWLPSLNVLYMLKMSHRYLKNSPHFLKTMRDIQAMRKAGAKIEERYAEFYGKRIAATYWYQHPNLNRTKEEFFNPEDKFYIYDHDSIHEAVSIGCSPAYTYYAVDGTEVLSSREKFFNSVTPQIRCRGVYEETCVLALERSQIPNDFKIHPRRSFLKALEKVCTSITSGWFREFAWENYDYILEMYDSMNENGRNYVDEFKKNSHKLRPYEGAMK